MKVCGFMGSYMVFVGEQQIGAVTSWRHGVTVRSPGKQQGGYSNILSS